MKLPHSISRYSTPTALLVALIVVAVASTAAASDLAEKLPESNDTVVVIDVAEIRDSPLYDRGFEIFSQQVDTAGFLTRLERDFELDLQSDVDTLVVSSDAPPIDTEMLEADDPGDAVDSAASHQPSESLLLARGDFEVAEVLRTAAEQLETDIHSGSDDDQIGAGASVRTDGFELHALSDETLAITAGSPDRLEEMRPSLHETPQGLSQSFERGIDHLGTGQGLYMLTEPTVQGDTLDADASFAGLSVDLADGLRLGSVVRLGDEETAGGFADQLDEARNQADSNPMTGLLGIDPLLENLSIQQSGTELTIRTSMTDREANYLLDQLGSILEAEQQLQQPLEGDGFETDDGESSTDGDEDDDSSDDDTDDDGVDAPFN